jgi:hypothetical protein
MIIETLSENGRDKKIKRILSEWREKKKERLKKWKEEKKRKEKN